MPYHRYTEPVASFSVHPPCSLPRSFSSCPLCTWSPCWTSRRRRADRGRSCSEPGSDRSQQPEPTTLQTLTKITGTTVEEIHRSGVIFASEAVHPPVTIFLTINRNREQTTKSRLARDRRDDTVLVAILLVPKMVRWPVQVRVTVPLFSVHCTDRS